nr:MAG TPA: hypothetical protein [Caudoviricetes sp.]
MSKGARNNKKTNFFIMIQFSDVAKIQKRKYRTKINTKNETRKV